jgi:hypothetical protein
MFHNVKSEYLSIAAALHQPAIAGPEGEAAILALPHA